MKKWIIIICLLLTLVVLYLSLGLKSEQYLGDNYYYLPKYEALDIGYPGGSIIYKSDKKNVFVDVKIPNEVIMVNKNKEYIIAIQQDHSAHNTSMPTNILDSSNLNYFIINKHTDIVYGPYTKTEYLKKKSELKIPHSLVFKGESKY